ncbi:hypothetical protein [Paenibacillus montanisoli]|uniref:hypothetical protein n=1 Tax=Paenibacillus montanisoli TaxID=2081970 RepID=UPI00140319CD|nr:hypothetical protein [Paenibacillus montanisoli]
MDKTSSFTYVPAGKHEDIEQAGSMNGSISPAALEAKWRVIDFILRKLIKKTD